MLYKVNKSDLYFLGSIHALDTTDLPFKDSIDSTYAAASRIVFETDIGITPDPSLTLLPEHLNLSSAISRDLFAVTRDTWDQFGLPPDLLERSKPWHAAHILLLMLLQQNGVSIQKGIDIGLWQRAIADNKDICTLETDAQAYAYLDAVPQNEQEAYLSFTVLEQHKVISEFQDIVSAYKTSDIEALNIMLQRRIELFPNIFSKLLDDRNKAWLHTFIKMAEDNTPTLVVVGGLHFVGTSSIPALLGKHGYSLSPV